VPADRCLEPLELRVLTQCVKCLATFCTYSWEIRELCHHNAVLAHILSVFELCSSGEEVSEDLQNKLEFNARAVMRLACNLVTGAHPESSIQSDCLMLVTESPKLMTFAGENAAYDEALILPFLVFLYNAMAKREDLRQRFLTAAPDSQGISTLVKIFTA